MKPRGILLCAIGLILVSDVDGESLACATTDVNLRSGPSTGYSIKGTLRPPYCLIYKGNTGTWAKVEYKGLSRWVSRRYLRVISSTGTCACATGNVNVRSGAGASYIRLSTLQTDSCLPYQGNLIRNGGYNWARVTYNARAAFVASNWLHFKQCSVNTPSQPSTESSSQCGTVPSGCPNIITRAEWGARPSKSSSRISRIPGKVFIHHGTGSTCTTEYTCKAKVRSYQRHHMNTRGWSDIGYSFVVGEDGNVYEGRGWMKAGAHTRGYNSRSYGICVIGDYSNRTPNCTAITAVRRLIQCGVDKNKLRSDYTVQGHRDVGSTKCPGQAFYNLIKTWSHYG